MRATLDLLGMYQYHPTLFDNLEIPEQLDKTVLTDNLLIESAEMEVLYSNADFMESAIGSWSQKMLPVWEELYKTTQYEYNPIWNKDGTVKETITRDLATTEDVITNVDREDKLQDKNTKNTEDKNTRNYTDANTKNLQDQETRNLSDVVNNSVYGFNSSTAAPSDTSQSTGTGTDTYNHTGTDTINHTGTDTYNHTGTDTIDHTGRQDIDTTVDRDTTDTGTITTEREEKGNIGLTSTQDLILQQREVVKLNLYDVIIKDFISRFCLGVF